MSLPALRQNLFDGSERMAPTFSDKKSPPPFNRVYDDYYKWKKRFLFWQTVTDVVKVKQGGWLILSLDSETSDEILELMTHEEIISDDGVEKILHHMDHIILKYFSSVHDSEVQLVEAGTNNTQCSDIVAEVVSDDPVYSICYSFDCDCAPHDCCPFSDSVKEDFHDKEQEHNTDMYNDLLVFSPFSLSQHIHDPSVSSVTLSPCNLKQKNDESAYNHCYTESTQISSSDICYCNDARDPSVSLLPEARSEDASTQYLDMQAEVIAHQLDAEDNSDAVDDEDVYDDDDVEVSEEDEQSYDVAVTVTQTNSANESCAKLNILVEVITSDNERWKKRRKKKPNTDAGNKEKYGKQTRHRLKRRKRKVSYEQLRVWFFVVHALLNEEECGGSSQRKESWKRRKIRSQRSSNVSLV